MGTVNGGPNGRALDLINRFRAYMRLEHKIENCGSVYYRGGERSDPFAWGIDGHYAEWSKFRQQNVGGE